MQQPDPRESGEWFIQLPERRPADELLAPEDCSMLRSQRSPKRICAPAAVSPQWPTAQDAWYTSEPGSSLAEGALRSHGSPATTNTTLHEMCGSLAQSPTLE